MGGRRTRRDRYLELWRRVGADAARFAFLLDPDPEAAAATAHTAFGRCVARMQDRRSADIIDVWFRREVVRQVARRTRRRRLRRVFGGDTVASDPTGVSSAGRELWHAFMSLPLKQRAAIVLDTFEHMPRLRAADALGRSEGGTGALIERGWDGLEARLGARPDDAELERLLTTAAGGLDVATTNSGAVRRLAVRARRLSTAVAILLAAGAAAGAIAATSAFSTSQLDAEESRITGVDDGSSDGGSAVGLGFRGTPGWCPDPRRTLNINDDTSREATRTAIRVAIAIVKGYTKELGHLIEVPAGAPPARRWAAPAGAARLHVLARGFGGLNDSLAIDCGVQVADRTWIVVIEDIVPPADDAVAFYVILRPDGFKVWGSYGALGR